MITLIDNYDSFTWNLVHYLEELGAQTKVIRNDEMTVEEALALKPDGIRLVQYNEAPAGQSVFHLHFHLIPVYEGEELGRHGQGKADDTELAELARSIAAQLN